MLRNCDGLVREGRIGIGHFPNENGGLRPPFGRAVLENSPYWTSFGPVAAMRSFSVMMPSRRATSV
jgi:hypothetical protein